MEEPRIEFESHLDPAKQVEILDRAIWHKWNKFTWSGLLTIGMGCLLIVCGLLLHSGAYSAEGLLIGFGSIIVAIGLIRIGIGLINPMLPSDLRSRHRHHHHSEQQEEEIILNTLRDR